MKYQASNTLVKPENNPYPTNITTSTRSSTQYVIPLTGPIGEIDEYHELFNILVTATEWDEIYIQLSSPGGSLETCDYLCRRMDECEAKITVEIGFTCASVASAIALRADDWVIYDSSTMMIQSWSYSPGYGKESDIRGRVAFMERVNLEWVERTYQGFLADEEFIDVLDNGKDLYFFADELRERMSLHNEYRKECKARKIDETLLNWKNQYAA
ncbi:ClpP class periplasmic serine protease [Pseudomonas sp. GM78]|uniref:ATP-dependent Clp protease proteolytic subunit n=1 Tax=Pseudomonas sp. GM78 TaxID=1144337 RepID=UPI000270B99C|nr:ATP-dependent Clp protease proteolytic subunit [Pseudomonas sp. GM78]EJN26741.1 ClpP class periplasmic serine protease [Pseudomonas sp. GM78]